MLDELTSEGIGEIDLLGHSMGGMIVQEMTALAPERVKRLIVYGSASSGNLPGRFETFARSHERVTKDGVEITARRISATWFVQEESAPEYVNCATIACRSTLQSLHAGLTAMETWSRTDNLEAITCPTLIVWGERDRTYRWPLIEELWRKIPNTSLAVMPGCAHAAHMEKPDLFNLLISDFLSEG